MEEQESVFSEQDYAIIGRFVTAANTIEMVVNLALETLMTHIGEKTSVSASETIYSLDELNKQSIRIRVSHIITLLGALNDNDSDISEAITYFKFVYTTYNKEVRNMRDFLAHNPMTLVSGTPRILNSRRYKKDNPIQSLDLHDLHFVIAVMDKILTNFDVTLKMLSTKFPANMAPRELTKPIVLKSVRQKDINKPRL